MGLRFRRRFTIGPGLRINLSKSGLSTSIGTRGAWLTLGHGKARETIGIPGSGLSYTEQQSLAAPPVESSAAVVADPGVAAPTSTGGIGALMWFAIAMICAGAVAVAVATLR